MKEFNLSEKIRTCMCPKLYENIPKEDVKEFIKLCEKLGVYANHKSDKKQLAWGDIAIRIADLKRLAGDKFND